MDDLLSDLNPAQRAAVTHEGGPLLIVAGPGSGKTRVITRRIAYRVSHGVPVERLLAITFTNNAATELRERLSHTTPAGQNVMAGTFHWAGNALLRRYAARLDRRPDFRVISGREARGVLAEAVKAEGTGSLSLPIVADAVSALKSGVVPEDVARRYGLRADLLRRL